MKSQSCGIEGEAVEKDGSLVLKRIIGIEKKNRVRITTMIESELVEVIKTNGLDIANTINIALEKYLKDRGFF